MLDEITNNLMEAGVCSLEYEVKDYIITRMKEELSEVEPNSSLGNDEIFELIDFPSIVSDECWIAQESVSNSITESMDSETYYTADCMSIIEDVGLVSALEAYIELNGDIGSNNIPDSQEIAIAVLYQNYGIDFEDVVEAFFDQLLGDYDVEEVCDEFRAGKLREDVESIEPERGDDNEEDC